MNLGAQGRSSSARFVDIGKPAVVNGVGIAVQCDGYYPSLVPLVPGDAPVAGCVVGVKSALAAFVDGLGYGFQVGWVDAERVSATEVRVVVVEDKASGVCTAVPARVWNGVAQQFPGNPVCGKVSPVVFDSPVAAALSCRPEPTPVGISDIDVAPKAHFKRFWQAAGHTQLYARRVAA